MKKITHLTPLSAQKKTSIIDLRVEYFEKIGLVDGNGPIKDFKLSILSNKFTYLKQTFPLSRKQKNILNFICTDRIYKKILIGSPSKLEDIITVFDINKWQKEISISKGSKESELTAFGKYILKSFGYKEKFRSRVKKGLWLANQLNIKSCPYCNSQYTLIVSKSNRKNQIAKFQFDHFFTVVRMYFDG